MDGWMDGLNDTDGWMDGWIRWKWMDGWIKRYGWMD